MISSIKTRVCGIKTFQKGVELEPNRNVGIVISSKDLPQGILFMRKTLKTDKFIALYCQDIYDICKTKVKFDSDDFEAVLAKLTERYITPFAVVDIVGQIAGYKHLTEVKTLIDNKLRNDYRNNVTEGYDDQSLKDMRLYVELKGINRK